MPIMNQAPQLYTEDVCRSFTLTDTNGNVTGSPTVMEFGPFYPGPYRGFNLRVDRESETGTCTLDCALYLLDENTGDKFVWLDNAGTGMLLPQWADGSAVAKWLTVHPGQHGGDVDGVQVVDTANRLYNTAWVSPLLVRLTTGGTSVTNVVSVSLNYLP